MLETCAASCERTAEQALKDSKELDGISSFFDLSAKDIHGNLVEFSKFQGQVTIIVNVASYCGYTDSHYRGLVKLFGNVKHTGKVNILAFPCNQFGEQEPKSNDEIFDFALGYGVEFTMMEKIDVNGPDSSVVYKFLKSKAGPATITWNFATYFVVSPDGSIESQSDIEPTELSEVALVLLGGEL
jgi:glutathione peroxidase-family protein